MGVGRGEEELIACEDDAVGGALFSTPIGGDQLGHSIGQASRHGPEITRHQSEPASIRILEVDRVRIETRPVPARRLSGEGVASHGKTRHRSQI